MCFPGVIKARYDKDDPSTWKHWQTADQKSTEEGRMTNPFASDDGRYDSLSGQTFDIQTQRGGMWENHLGTYKGRNAAFDMKEIDDEWERNAAHKEEIAEIENRSSSGEQRFYWSHE